jgi:hypothetical protein
MKFEDYLMSKNINSEAYKVAELSQFLTWENAFNQMHPNSFTEQYKFQLNKIRRKYILKNTF